MVSDIAFVGFANPSDNVDVVLIIDSSGSMGSNDPDDQRLDAAKAYLTASIPGDFVGVVDFDGSVRLASPLLELPDNKDEGLTTGREEVLLELEHRLDDQLAIRIGLSRV